MSLLEFFGNNCPHCIEMVPVVEEVEKELGVEFEKLEVWENEENAKRQEEFDKGLCGGVPFFYNTENKKHLCGSVSKQALVEFARVEETSKS